MGAYSDYKIVKDNSGKELQDKVKGAVDSGFKKIKANYNGSIR